jgi:hypothetical protein
MRPNIFYSTDSDCSSGTINLSSSLSNFTLSNKTANVNVVPNPTVEQTLIQPSRPSQMSLHIERPNPMPVSLKSLLFSSMC